MDFWEPKLDRNIRRDRKNIRALRHDGWKVLVIWECQAKNENAIALILRRFLESRRRTGDML